MERYRLAAKPIPANVKPGRRVLVEACLAEMQRGDDAIASLYAMMVVKSLAELDEAIAKEFAHRMASAGIAYNRYARARVT